MVSKLSRIFFQGLLTLLPITLTLYLVITLVTSVERFSRGFLDIFLTKEFNLPGLGILLTFLIVMLAGVFAESLTIAPIMRALEWFFDRVPLIKIIYRPLKDLVGFFSKNSKVGADKKVVLVPSAEGRYSLGIVMNSQPQVDQLSDYVAVYLPLSYALGGYTILVKRDHLIEVPMKAEEALRLAVTGWAKS